MLFFFHLLWLFKKKSLKQLRQTKKKKGEDNKTELNTAWSLKYICNDFLHSKPLDILDSKEVIRHRTEVRWSFQKFMHKDEGTKKEQPDQQTQSSSEIHKITWPPKQVCLIKSNVTFLNNNYATL